MQKWQIELNATPLWLLYSFVGVMLVFFLAVWLIGRTTTFGKQFRYISAPCFDTKSRIKLIALIALMVLLLLTDVRMNVLSTFMTAGLLNSLQDLNAQAFGVFVAMNVGIVLLRGLNGIVNDFLDQSVAIKWAERLNALLVERWLADKNYYRLQMRRHAPDNIDQRIQQDAQDFIVSTVEFVRGMLNSVLSSIEFAIVLWGLAGMLSLFGFEIPKGLVFFVFSFVLLATVAAMWIGKPLIKYNYENEKLNGDYRYSLIRVRDHAESVAFYQGEASEHEALHKRFAQIIRNRWRLARQSVALNGFNEVFSSMVQLLPVILQAPRVFAREIKVGDVQQTVQVFARLQKALSFFRLFYEKFTAYRARLERLYGFLSSMDDRGVNRQAQRRTEVYLQLKNVSLLRHNGEALLEGINLSAQQGQRVLIQGRSGCGKTSLLRLLADLWPFGSGGEIAVPPREGIMFVPQRPYVPQGTLREAVCYPNIDAQHPELEQILQLCRLERHLPDLDSCKDWQHVLSPGELQRIAFARILLAKPQLVLLDEATAALDEATEAHLYGLLIERLPDAMLVSIGHRNTLLAFHNVNIDITPTQVRASCS